MASTEEAFIYLHTFVYVDFSCGDDMQDWETVVFRKAKKDNQGNASDSASSSASQAASQASTAGRPAWKVEKIVDEGGKLGRVPRETAQAIVAGRVAKRLTQETLAAALRMQARDIKDIESGRAIENRQVLAKIRAYLGI